MGSESIDFQPSRVDRQNRLKSSRSIESIDFQSSWVDSIRSTRSISRSSKRVWQRAWRYPAYLWSLRWVGLYAVKKTPVVGIRRIPAYTPPNTPLITGNCFCHHRIIIQHIPLGHHSMREELLLLSLLHRHLTTGASRGLGNGSPPGPGAELW